MGPRFYAFAAFFLLISVCAHADQVYLDNGDRLTGKVLEANEESVVVETVSAGTVSVKRSAVTKMEPMNKIPSAGPYEAQPAPVFKGEAAAGYAQAGGNTRSSQMYGSFLASRKLKDSELQFKGNADYSSQESKMNGQRYYLTGRYDQRFGETDRRWYRFFKQEFEHDRFTNVQYCLIPSVGAGYWFADTPDWKLMTEAGVGLDHTHYRDLQKDTDELILVPRLYFERRLGKFRLSEDLNLYPALTGTSKLRIRLETALEYPLSDRLSSRFSLIDDYNSEPQAGLDGVQKNDWRVISSLVYSF